eukprot:scaffold758_cov177-Amphora_coffeaeformis.AAC.7
MASCHGAVARQVRRTPCGINLPNCAPRRTTLVTDIDAHDVTLNSSHTWQHFRDARLPSSLRSLFDQN